MRMRESGRLRKCECTRHKKVRARFNIWDSGGLRSVASHIRVRKHPCHFD